MSEEEATFDEFSKSEDTKADDISTETPQELDLGPRSLGLPDQWGKTEFGSTFSHQRGVNYSSDNYVSEGEGMIFLTLNAIAPGGGLKKDSLKFYDDDISDEKTTTEGDILMANTDLNQDGEIIGYPVRVPSFESAAQKCFSHHLLKIEQKRETYDSQFLEYLFSADYIHDRMIAFSCGSTVLNLNTDLLDSLELPVPPLEEQRKIASMLYTVDQAIQKTEEAINQINKVKTGVEQDIFRNGLASDTHQEVKLGPKTIRVPEKWKISSLGEISNRMRNGFVGTATPYYTNPDDGVPYLQSFNVRANRIEGRDDMEYVEQSFHEDNPKTELKEGDLLTVQSGHIGTSSVVPPEFDGANAHALIITRFDEQQADPYYISQFINSKIGTDLIKSITVGTTVDHVNVKEFSNMQVPLPPLTEQQRIVSVLSTFDNLRSKEEKLKERLVDIKNGLMQDLLSGEVCTHDPDIEILDDIL